MAVDVREGELAGLRRLALSGARREVFAALGAAARDSVRAVVEPSADDADLRKWLWSAAGKERYGRLVEATRRSCGPQWAELAALAGGSGVGFEELLVTNLRGDLGVEDGTGCSDLGYHRSPRSFVAHNEDGFPAAVGHLTLVTLALDGQAPVTALWYPGFLTANAFTATGHGLVWGVNHIPVVRPEPTGAGRHFVARALQEAPTLDAALAHLRARPTAGGYTYTIGERASGRVVVVEAVAGRVAVREAGPDGALLWHTNHLRHLPDPADSPTLLGDGPAARTHTARYEESLARGRALAALRPPEAPTTDWFMEALTSAAPPLGVHRTAAGTDPLTTLCTLVADLSEGTVTLRGRDGRSGRLPLPVFSGRG
ncbi:C45 family autoproteolytic acyltransferase/hydrolase [Streptomyces sp. NPDC059991]|uniref:C45 family autoproteolytic acyltransferase/hydolase n=1 Tax=Streptomyces sp. NPDC059991 TaxID=3347028 RepID=UPI0036CAC48C